MQVSNIQAAHYWPGASIPVPLPADGISFSFSTEFVVYYPGDPNAPSGYKTTPGYDSSRPPGVRVGRPDVLWNFLGEGLWVDIWVLGLGTQGPRMTLYRQNDAHDGWHEAPMPSNLNTGLAESAGRPSDTGVTGYRSAAALRVYLDQGVAYVLIVEPQDIDSSVHPEIPHGFGGYIEDFYMEMSYTSTELPNHRTQPWDVTIAVDGATYASPLVLNTAFDTSPDEDPPTFPSIGGTAWWRYECASDCDLTVSFAIVPQYTNWYSCNIYKQQPDGSIILLAGTGNPPNTVTVPAVKAGDVLYIQIGFQGDNRSQNQAQKYQLDVTGGVSNIQSFFVDSEQEWVRVATHDVPLRVRVNNGWKVFAAGGNEILRVRGKDKKWYACATGDGTYGVVRGVVTAIGTPVVNHFVWIEDPSTGLATAYSTFTAADGTFELAGLPFDKSFVAHVRVRDAYPPVIWDESIYLTKANPVHIPHWWANGPAVTGIE